MSFRPIQLVGPYHFSQAGLAIKGKPSFAQAGTAGTILAGLERGAQKALAEWFGDVKERFPETYSQLLDPQLFDEETLKNYLWVTERIPRDNWRLEAGVSWTKHQAVAGLDAANQRRILERAAREHLTLVEVRAAVRKVKAQRVAEGRGELAGQYRLLYCDPPFETMSLEALAKIPVAAHLQANAAAFVWCDERHRFDIKAVLDAWQLEHRSALVWHTQSHAGPHAYLSLRHWHLLWCVRGTCPPDNPTPMQESLVSIRAPESGEKPGKFREIVDRLYDHGEVLELFASEARERERWTCFGSTIGAQVA